MLLDRLLYRMNVIFSESLPADSLHSPAKSHHWHLHATQPAPWYTHITDALDESSSLKKSMAFDLQFHAMETRLELLLQPCQHLLVGSHPHQSVDGDSLFSPTERRVEKFCQVLHSGRNRNPFCFNISEEEDAPSVGTISKKLLRCIEERSEGCFQTEGER